MNALEREIAAAAAQAARRLAAAGVPVDRDDVAQEAFAIAMEAAETWDADVGPLGAYLSTVLRRALGKVTARWRCPLSLPSDHDAAAAPEIERGEADDVSDDAATPEQLVAEAEARAQVARAVARALAEMPARAAELAADLAAPSPVVAARFGVAPARVREVRADLVRRVRIATAR